ncbi:MAG: tyrosine-protein phosphatase [Eubacterium sp.]|nr:tyrosine-protein phosphatase [Eubacterium sp.]
MITVYVFFMEEFVTVLIKWFRNNIPIVHTKIREITEKGDVILACEYNLFFERHIHLMDVVLVRVAGEKIRMPVCRKRTDVDLRVPFLKLQKNKNRATITSFFGQFAKDYGVSVDDDVWIFLAKKRGYKKGYQAHQYLDSDERENFVSDEHFSNFRELTIGNIRKNTFYRSSNPLFYKLYPNRSIYAAKMLEKYHIASVINLENTRKQILRRFKEDPDSLYKKMWDDNRVYQNHLTTDMNSVEFVDGMIECFRKMIEMPTPILIHCNQGKNRTGCICAWIGALMGASYDEIVNDFMLSYTFLHQMDEDKEGWDFLIKGNVEKHLKMTFLDRRYKRRDPQKYVREYLAGRGMTEEEMDLLVAHLS